VPPYAEVCSEYDIPLPGTPKAEDNCDKYVGITYNGEYKEFDPNCKFIIKRIRTWTATDDCGNTATATQVIAVKYPPYSGGWAKADKYEFCNAWGNESVNLTVWNYSGDIVRWEMDLGCKGNWVAIPNTAGKASITVVPPSPKDDSECGVCYRAVIGNCAGCGYVYSEKAYVKPDVPAKGGKIVLKKDMMSNYYAICPGENIYLKLSGYVGRIIKWQYTTANSGSWYDIPNSAGQTELYVEGDNISTTTYYRAIICSICGVCLPPFYTDYSHVFTLQKRNSCSSMWNTPGTGAPNFDLTLLRVYPAPALDRVTLEINGVTEGVANIEIVDIAGKVMLNNKQAVVQGFNEVKVDISRLSSGLYILRFTDSNNKRVTTKVNKQ
jgi:hypothetical protein